MSPARQCCLKIHPCFSRCCLLSGLILLMPACAADQNSAVEGPRAAGDTSPVEDPTPTETDPEQSAVEVISPGAGQPPTGPTVRIIAPTDRSIVSGPDVETRVAVENFAVVAKQGAASQTGEGHIHFYLDVRPLPAAPGQHAAPPGRRGYYSTSNNSYVWRGLAAGTHELGVQLVTNDHLALATPVTDEITVTVQ